MSIVILHACTVHVIQFEHKRPAQTRERGRLTYCSALPITELSTSDTYIDGSGGDAGRGCESCARDAVNIGT